MLSSAQTQLGFSRHDIFTTATAMRGCLAVYPMGKKARQRLAVADSTGVATVFSVGRHHEPKVEFATEKEQKPVTRLSLYQDQLFLAAGPRIAAYSRKGKNFFSFQTNLTESINCFYVDTPFIFAGGDFVLTSFQEVSERGFYMAPDRMNDMVVLRRGDPAAEPTLQTLTCFVACSDRSLRAVRESKVQQESNCEAPLTAVALALPIGGGAAAAPTNGKASQPPLCDVVYGTAAGSIGAFSVVAGASAGASEQLARKYAVIPPARLPGVTALACADINRDGVADLLVGRDDGSVEVHVMAMNGDGYQPAEAWANNVGEFINTIASGFVTNVDREEVLVHTFSGKVVAFTMDAEDAQIQAQLVPSALASAGGGPQQLPTAQAAEASEARRNKEAAAAAAAAAAAETKTTSPASSGQQPAAQTVAPPPATLSPLTAAPAAGANDPGVLELINAKVRDAEADVQRLRAMVEARKRDFATLTGVGDVTQIRAIASEFRVRDSIVVDGALTAAASGSSGVGPADSATLLLTIEADVELDCVALESDAELEIADAATNAAADSATAAAGGAGGSLSTMAIACAIPIGANKTTKLHAVLRPGEQTPTKVEVRLRVAAEGAATGGTLRAFVLAKSTPRTAQLRSFTIRPLALHQRIAEADIAGSLGELPLSSIRFSGGFSLKDAHAWLFTAVPDIPEHAAAAAAASASDITYYHRSAALGTILVSRVARGELELLSDSLSTLATLKEHISREATARRVAVSLRSNYLEASAVRQLGTLLPLVQSRAVLVAQHRLIDALKEIEGQEQESAAFMSADYRYILANASAIEREIARQPQRMQQLKLLIVRLFVDFCNSGIAATTSSAARIADLEGRVDACDARGIEALFAFRQPEPPTAAQQLPPPSPTTQESTGPPTGSPNSSVPAATAARGADPGFLPVAAAAAASASVDASIMVSGQVASIGS